MESTELQSAEKAYADLIEERRANRESMSRAEWPIYNQATFDEQREKQQAVAAAIRNRNHAPVNAVIGTINEKDES